MSKWYCKYLEWKGKDMMSRDTIDENRKEYDEYLSAPLKHKAFTPWMAKCTEEMFIIKGADDNDMEVYMVKSKANADKKDLAMIVNFHGGGAYLGHPTYDFAMVARWAVESDVVIFSIRYRLAPEV
jgi:acetyl esterase/lipase